MVSKVQKRGEVSNAWFNLYNLSRCKRIVM